MSLIGFSGHAAAPEENRQMPIHALSSRRGKVTFISSSGFYSRRDFRGRSIAPPSPGTRTNVKSIERPICYAFETVQVPSAQGEAMTIDPEKPDLTFVHLSDIHFRQGWTGDAHDEDLPIRRELQFDLRRLHRRVPQMNGLLLSGDIAFGGKEGEYDYARGWIESICELLRIDRSGVMLAPGNHDVDRDVVVDGGDIDQLQMSVRACTSLPSRDERLAKILRDAQVGENFLKGMAAYNKFAAEYKCGITREKPYWEKDFLLADGTTFRFESPRVSQRVPCVSHATMA
jgi:hypothetical protein